MLDIHPQFLWEFALVPMHHDQPALSESQAVSRRALLAAGGAALLSGCHKRLLPPAEEGVAVVVPTQRATWIRNFNPYFQSQCRWPGVAGIYEPTVIYNRARGKFVPWLARSWRWENGNKTMILTLRDGVKWADGRPLLPSDVVFTFELMKQHEALDQSSIWKHLNEVTRRGPEISFAFHHPFTLPALFLIGRQPIVAQHIWKQVKNPVTHADPHPVGTGPFNQILSFKPQMYEVGANPNYWQPGKPGLKKLRIPAFGGNEAQALALINGEVDWGAAFLPAIDRIYVSRDPKHRGYYFPSLEGTVMLYPNTTQSPYDQVVVRKAISHAIDRKTIVRVAMQGYTRVADATGLSDLYKKYHDPRVLTEEGDHTIYDPHKAASMFDAAGLRLGKTGFRTLQNGAPWVVDLNCVVGWSDWIIAGEIMVKNLRALGVNATLRTYAHGAWFDKLQRGDFQLSMCWSDGAATPHSFYQRLMSKDTLRPLGELAENNWHRFKSERADELLDALAATADAQQQWQLASDLQREFVRHAPAIPIFPGPTWGQSNTIRVEGFPSKDHPYSVLAPYKSPDQLLTLVELRPTGTPPLCDNPGEGAVDDLPGLGGPQ